MNDNPGRRSILHYKSEDELREALLTPVPREGGETTNVPAVGHLQAANRIGVAYGHVGRQQQLPPADSTDWLLESFDEESSEVQSFEEEVQRLQVLRSYQALEMKPEEPFDRITRMAARYFGVEIALITLMDLGRLWILSNQGLPGLVDFPRKESICAHTMISKSNILISNDALQDVRFIDDPAVKWSPFIRFYAGACLLTPEGFKIGTFCICGLTPRPQGLSPNQRAVLQDMSVQAVQELMKRRCRIHQRIKSDKWLAYKTHELITPFSGVQLSLGLLQEDEEVQKVLLKHDQERLEKVALCANSLFKVYEKAVETLQDDHLELTKMASARPLAKPPVLKYERYSTELQKEKYSAAEVSEKVLEHLSNSLYHVPKVTPVILSRDSFHKDAFMKTDELRLFRISLNMIGHALERSTKLKQPRAISFRLSQSISSLEHSQPVLLCECTDYGPAVSTAEYQSLLPGKHSSAMDCSSPVLALRSVATQVGIMKGKCGLRHSTGETTSGVTTTFWFQIPLDLDLKAMVPASVIDQQHSIHSPMSGSAICRNTMIQTEPKESAQLNHTTLKLPVVCEKGFCCNDVSLAHQNPNFKGLAGRSLERRISGRQRYGSAIENDGMDLQTSAEKAFQKIALDSALRQKRALVIDDVAMVRKILSRALVNMGYDVDHAENGSVGLEQMKSVVYDLVLCDFLMPVMDGLDCVSQFRSWENEQPQRLKMYIVGISAHADPRDQQRGIDSGMNEFQAKPITINMLKEIVQRDAVQALSLLLDAAVTNTSGGNAPRVSRRGSNGAIPNGKKPRLTARNPESCESRRVRRCLIFSKIPGLAAQTMDPGASYYEIALTKTGSEAFSQLQAKIWDVVLVEEGSYHDDTKLFSVEQYRQWERKNRRVDQKSHIIMVSSHQGIRIMENQASIVLPPSGFDSVLGQPFAWSTVTKIASLPPDAIAGDNIKLAKTRHTVKGSVMSTRGALGVECTV